MVDYDLEVEDAVFILVHLFGHTVQWNVSARRASRRVHEARQLDRRTASRGRGVRAARLAATSLQLLHDAGFHELDQWVSDFAACDVAYLMHFYRTGEKLPFRSFWKDNAELLTALPIPEFQPTQWIGRNAGTVI